MEELTEHGRTIVESVAERHGVSAGAVISLLRALAAGQGSQAQFNHPDLGGMGQWSRGGMIMVGDMFNQGLKARIDALCTELSDALLQDSVFASARPASSQSQSQSSGAAGSSLFVSGGAYGRDWWPEGLGAPSSVGSQNNLRYALFPATRRLAIDIAGKVTLYDTLDHNIAGFSQQQSGDQSLTFTSQHGLVRVADLPVIPDEKPAPEAAKAAAEAPEPRRAATKSEAASPDAAAAAEEKAAAASAGPEASAAPEARASVEEDVIGKIERLAELRKKDILTQEEFNSKKAELLARL